MSDLTQTPPPQETLLQRIEDPFVSIWRKIATAISHLANHTPLQDEPRAEVASTVAELHGLAGQHEYAMKSENETFFGEIEEDLGWRHPIHEDIAAINAGAAQGAPPVIVPPAPLAQQAESWPTPPAAPLTPPLVPPMADKVAAVEAAAKADPAVAADVALAGGAEVVAAAETAPKAAE